MPPGATPDASATQTKQEKGGYFPKADAPLTPPSSNVRWGFRVSGSRSRSDAAWETGNRGQRIMNDDKGYFERTELRRCANGLAGAQNDGAALVAVM
jgi:hypothetical protein